MSRDIQYRNLPLLLLQAREVVLGHFRPLLAQFGLTEQQWRVIRVLHEVHVLEPREICEKCQILSSSLAGVLARMEDTDLVTRSRMRDDQRRVIVRLTPKSRKLFMKLRPLVARQYKLIEQAYGPELIRDLYAVTDRLLAAADKNVPSVAARPARD